MELRWVSLNKWLIRQQALQRLIREIAQEFVSDLRSQDSAVLAL